MGKSPQEQTIIFDGKCALCSRCVLFIQNRSNEDTFTFVPALSAEGQLIQEQLGTDALRDHTLLLVQDDQVLDRSDAALAIAGQLNGAWKCLSYLRFIPRKLRDGIYRVVAQNRKTTALCLALVLLSTQSALG